MLNRTQSLWEATQDLRSYQRAELIRQQRSRSLPESAWQGNPPTKNGHAPLNYRIKKELSYCQSSPYLDLVSFLALSQIKPQAPRLVVPFRQFLQVSALRPYFPQNPKTLISLWIPTELLMLHGTPVGIVYSQDYYGIWSYSIPWPSFLIKENILDRCFRFCLSLIGPRISPLSIKYKCPRLFLKILTNPSTETREIIFVSFHAEVFRLCLPWTLWFIQGEKPSGSHQSVD